jgi:hypothetical protein
VHREDPSMSGEAAQRRESQTWQEKSQTVHEESQNRREKSQTVWEESQTVRKESQTSRRKVRLDERKVRMSGVKSDWTKGKRITRTREGKSESVTDVRLSCDFPLPSLTLLARSDFSLY